jgi:hypothetical protein
MMVDPMLHRLLVVCCYPLVVLLSLVQAAAAEAPVRYTHQGQIGVYRLQLSTVMLAPAFPTVGATSMPPMPLALRRVSSGAYILLVRRLQPGWWYMRLVVQGDRGTARGVIPLRVEEPAPPLWLVWRMGLLTLAVLVYVVWEHNRHESLNGCTSVREGEMADRLW